MSNESHYTELQINNLEHITCFTASYVAIKILKFKSIKCKTTNYHSIIYIFLLNVYHKCQRIHLFILACCDSRNV